MKTEEMVAIPCTRRAMRELVDGTLRVQIDIEPMFKQRFIQLMGEIDITLAVTPLLYAPVPPDPEQPADEMSRHTGWRDLGRLAQSAVVMCKDERFQKFAAEMSGEKELTEKVAAQFVKLQCKVSTRKELDTKDGAATRFGALMAQYREWQERNPIRPL